MMSSKEKETKVLLIGYTPAVDDARSTLCVGVHSMLTGETKIINVFASEQADDIYKKLTTVTLDEKVGIL